jgi:xanthine dehydrogenase YagT iron-sulfur-binding subunit
MPCPAVFRRFHYFRKVGGFQVSVRFCEKPRSLSETSGRVYRFFGKVLKNQIINRSKKVPQPELTRTQQNSRRDNMYDFEEEDQNTDAGESRRDFLKKVTALGAGAAAVGFLDVDEIYAEVPDYVTNVPADAMNIKLNINGAERSLPIDSRTSLLDALRERLDLTGSKKGCDHGQCGACTVIIDGRRMLSCLTLAAMCDGKKITTIEGIADGDKLHPLQQAFLDKDALQCGYCTPGQICSAIAMLNEAKKRRRQPDHAKSNGQSRRPETQRRRNTRKNVRKPLPLRRLSEYRGCDQRGP